MNQRNPDRKSTASVVFVLQDLLRAIIRQPAKFSDDSLIFKALRSQNGIAKLETAFENNGETNIKSAVSINTLKAHSNFLLPRGFEGIDELRKSALEAIDTYNKRLSSPNKRTYVGLSKLTQDLELQLDKHQRINFILLQGLSLAISHLRNIRSDIDPLLMEYRAKEVTQSLISLLTLNPPPFDVTVEIQEKSNTYNMNNYRK